MPFLRQIKRQLTDPGGGTFQDRLDNAFKAVGGKQQEFECFISVNRGHTSQLLGAARDSLQPLVVAAAEEPLITAEFDRHLPGASGPQSRLLLRVLTRGLDPYDAAEVAYTQLRVLYDTVQTFTPRVGVRLRTPFLLVRGAGITSKVAPDVFRPLDTVPAPKENFAMSDAVSALSGVGDVDRERLTSALQLLRISLSATTDETKLVTAWMGLEAVARDR